MLLDKIIAVRAEKTVYRDGEHCIKVFGGSYTQADVLSEALHQARAAETGLPVPRVQDVTMIDDKWAIVSEYIAGKSMERMLQERPDSAEALLELLAELYMQIFRTDCPMLVPVEQKMKRNIGASLLDARKKAELLSALPTFSGKACLLHGDFCPSNVMVSEEGVPYIIDWSNAAEGNCVFDIACSCLLFYVEGQPQWGEMYRERILRCIPLDPTQIHRAIPLIAASRSCTARGSQKNRLLAIARGRDPQNSLL